MPLYQAIARIIRDGIQDGSLKPGDQLPPHRDLADKMGVTVGTVARGYNLAASWDLVSGEVGRGTIVSSPDSNYTHVPLDLGNSYCDLGVLKPTPPSDLALRKLAFEDTLKKVGQRWRNRSFFGFAPEFGLAQYREAGMALISRFGVAVDEGEVLITAGGQEAFLVLLTVLTTPGDTVLVEELTHISFKELGKSLHLKMMGIPMDEQGIMPDALEAVVRQTKARVLFITPTYNSPTTAVMGEKRRARVVDIALKHGVFIIENGIFSNFIMNSPDPVVNMCPEQAAYVASFSFCASPEIRVGYLKTHRKHTPKLKSAKRALAVSGSMISAEIATHWIKTGVLQDLIKWQTAEIRSRTRAAFQILDGLDFSHAPDGMFIWLNLPDPWRSTDFAKAAKDRGVLVMESERFVIGRGAAPHAVRISLTSAQTRESFIRGIETVADLIES